MERFDVVHAAQEALAKRGYYLFAVEKEHTEGVVTQPLLQRIRTTIRKRGFGNVAGHLAVTFSGYHADPREVYEVPEIRAYWRSLDRQLPEWPALLAFIPEMEFNGPGLQVLMLGDVDTAIHHPERGGSDVWVVGADDVTADAHKRIRAAGQKYHLSERATVNLVEHFTRAVHHRR